MAASDHLHPLQMKLFVDPQEHIDTLKGSIDYYNKRESWDDLWAQKEREARVPRDPDPTKRWQQPHGSGTYDSVKEHGVLTRFKRDEDDTSGGAPQVMMAYDQSGWVQGEGHHRIAAAAAVQRDTGKQQWVPIEYEASAAGRNRTTKSPKKPGNSSMGIPSSYPTSLG